MQNSAELLEKVKNYKPESSMAELQSFISGSIHADFCNEMLARIEDMRDFNEECGSKEYLETRGGIKALRLSINIFRDLLNNKIVDLKEESDE